MLLDREMKNIHCLLRIVLKSTNCVPIPIEHIQTVQAVCLLGDERKELSSIVVNNSPVQWTVTAVFDSAALTELAEKDRSSAAADGRQKRDFDFLNCFSSLASQTPIVRSWLSGVPSPGDSCHVMRR